MSQTVERFLSAYASGEEWKIDHDAAMKCFDLEELIATGPMTLRLITERDSNWQALVAEGKIPFDKAAESDMEILYKRWIVITENILARASQWAGKGFDVRGTEELSVSLEEARCIVEASEIEAEMRPIEAILPLVRGNPRPAIYGQ